MTAGRWVELGAVARVAGYVPVDERSRSVLVADRDRAGGWYTRAGDVCREAVYTGVVIQLPARRGVTRYVPGYLDSETDTVCLAWGEVYATGRGEDGRESDALRRCARYADALAERAAEAAREADEAWQAGVRWADSRAESAVTRARLRALLRELRALPAGAVGPATCEALRGAVRYLLRDLDGARAERARLVEAQTTDAEREAFEYGAGARVFV